MDILLKSDIPEKDGDNIYNTCIAFSSTEEQLAKYRKLSVRLL